jgi:hypothetical protein
VSVRQCSHAQLQSKSLSTGIRQTRHQSVSREQLEMHLNFPHAQSAVSGTRNVREGSPSVRGHCNRGKEAEEAEECDTNNHIQSMW